jgi:Ca2+-binding RTX toxin-like protein
MATTTTKIALNGAYLLADKERFGEFKAALDSFVDIDDQHRQLKSSDSKIKSTLPSFNQSIDESKKLNISNVLSNYSKFDEKILKNISDSSSAIDPNNVSSLLASTITKYVLEPNTNSGKTVQVPTLQAADGFDSNILLIGTPEVPGLAAIKEVKEDAAKGIAAQDAILSTPTIPATNGKWVAKIKGSDAYDSNLKTPQTIDLVSSDGSTLIVKMQNTDASNNSNSYEFSGVNSDGGNIRLSTNSTISNAAPVVVVNPKAKPAKVNPNIKLAYEDKSNIIIYTNEGVAGTKDDIRADLTQISNAVFTTKNNVFSAKINYKESLNYYEGDKFKVDISTEKNVLSNSPSLSFSGAKNTITINRYDILFNDDPNPSENFSVSLSGTVTNSWGVDGNTEIMNLKNVAVETADYSLRSASMIYKNTYTNNDYFAEPAVKTSTTPAKGGGLTNLDTYNLTPIQDNKMRDDLKIRVIESKLLAGDNDINLKQAATIDAGAGKDTVYGSIGDDSIIGGIGADSLVGADGNDMINGDSGEDIISGGAGDDTLTGGDGADKLAGGAGNDSLIGDAGSDNLTGGKGADIFSFQTSDFLSINKNGDLVFNKSVDTVTDFNKKEGDNFNFNDMGSLEFPQSLANAKTATTALFYFKGSVYFDDPNDSVYKPVVIIKLTGSPKVAADFTDFLA